MAESKYAVVGTWTLAEGRWEEQVRGLREQIVPLVRQSPGFVAGYWLGDRATGRTSSTVILEDEEAARHFQAFVAGNPANREQAGVTLESLTIVEVTAEVHR
jgi:hypothetical protein